MHISYSAPGKIILSGEHSVVYTKPAFVTAIDLRLTCTIEDKKNIPHDTGTDQAILSCDEVVKKYLINHHIPFQDKPYSYTIHSAIPTGRGMGSSAAFCVATCAALYHWYTGTTAEKDICNTLAYQCEKYFHGMPSGVDVSAATFGGLIFYRKEFEFLKTISALTFKIPPAIQNRLILIDSGKPAENTAQMIAHVGKRYNANPRQMEQTLSAIEKVTKQMVVSIIKEDAGMFAGCIEKNEQLLEELGIVSPETVTLFKEIGTAGVGKVTGAGGITKGSGLILFYIKHDKIWHEMKDKYKVLPFRQDFQGVTGTSQKEN